MANHISHASLPFPVKNARFTVLVPYVSSSGVPTDPTTPDTEVSQDGGSFADCTEEVTTITGSNGMGYITLTGAEMNNSAVGVAAKVASGPNNTLMTIYPRLLPILLSGTASAGASGSITLAAGAYDLTGCIVRTTGGTGGGGTGGANNQARVITAYNTSTLVATVVPNWETTPSSDTTYDILLTDMAVNSPITRGLRPATDGRTAVVDSAGLIDANMVKAGPTGSGTAQTARDLGANAGGGSSPALYLIRKNGATSNVIRVKLRRLDTNQGLTGLAFNTSSLEISTLCDNESAAINYTAGGSTIETVSGALGTYAAPTATKCRFVEVDSTNQPGLYEIHLADARFAVSSAKVLRLDIFGAANLRDTEVIVQLTSADVDGAYWANINTIYNTDYATNYDATNHFWNTNFGQALPSAPVANSFGEALFFADIMGGRVNTAAGGTSTTITLDASASSDSSSYIGDCVYLYGGTGGGIRGTGQRRTVVAYNGSTKVATVDRAWTTTPDNTSKFMMLPEPLANVGMWSGSALLPLLGKTIYVATTGNDSNSGTKSAPKLTVNGAIAIAVPWDTISIGAGTYTATVTNAVNNLTILGAGRDPTNGGTLLTYNSGSTFTNTGNNLTIRGLSIRATATGPTPTTQHPFHDSGTYGTWVDKCDFRGGDDCIVQVNCFGFRGTDSRFSSKWDCTNGVTNGLFEGCQFRLDGDFDSTAAFQIVSMQAGTFRNCYFSFTRSTDTTLSGETFAVVCIGGAIVLEACYINLQVTGANSLGKAVAFKSSQGGSICAIECEVSVTHTDPSKAYYWYQDDAASRLTLVGTDIDETKVGAATGTPNIRYIDGGSVPDSQTTIATNTGTLLTNVAAIPAAVWNSLSSGLSTANSIGKRIVDYLTGDIFGRLGAPAGASIADDISNVSGGGGSTVDPFTVDKEHTFQFANNRQTTASNIIDEPIGFNALLAMDFDNQIPKRTSIASITTAAFTGTGTKPTISSSLPSADRRAAHIMVDASAATAGTYLLTVTILTADGQTFVRSGRFTVT